MSIEEDGAWGKRSPPPWWRDCQPGESALARKCSSKALQQIAQFPQKGAVILSDTGFLSS